MHKMRCYGRVSDGHSLMIQSLELVGSVYVATPTEKRKARKAILQHDPTAIDILEILGLTHEQE